MSQTTLMAVTISLILMVQPQELLGQSCVPDPIGDWSWNLPPGAEPTYLNWVMNGNSFPDQDFVRLVQQAPHIWNIYASTRIQLRQTGTTTATTLQQLQSDTHNQVIFFNGTCNQFFGYSCGDGLVRGSTRRRYSSGGMVEFDIILFRDQSPGYPFPWNTSTMLSVAVHEFGHALGLEHSASTNTIMYFDNVLNQQWAFLSWDDVTCLRTTGTGYGLQEREIHGAYTDDNGENWSEIPTSFSGVFPGVHYAPTIAGNETAASGNEAYMAAWTNADDRIFTELGNGWSFFSNTRVEHTCDVCYSYLPVALTWGQERWLLTWVSATDRNIYTKYSWDGVSWSTPYLVETGDFVSPPSVAFNDWDDRYLLATVETSISIPTRTVRIWESLEGLYWWEPEVGYTSPALFVDLSCNHFSERCTMAYTDYYNPLLQMFHDLYFSSIWDEFRLSSYYGQIGSYDYSWFVSNVAHRTYGSIPDDVHQEAIFVRMDAPYYPLVYSTTREANVCGSSCNWMYNQSYGYPSKPAGRVTIASGDYYEEHQMFFAIDPI